MTPPAPLGIDRKRLTARLLDAPPGLRIVVGPAGSGKTTVLAHAAAAFEGRCVWLSLDGTDRRRAALTRALGAAAGLNRVSDVLQVVASLDDGDPTLVVVDDVHEVGGSPGGEAIDLLCRYRPPRVTLALAARDLRDLHQWRWRSDPDAVVVDVELLRFRLWEVDELFRHLRSPLAPADLHTLSQRTDGWAVALRLFHVALRDAPDQATALLARSPRFTHRSIRAYLREEVLARVSDGDRAFLKRTAVLDRLLPSRCDELLGRPGSAQQLEDLAASGLLVPDHEGAGYRVHGLLRAHLLSELVDEVGDATIAALHRRAALVLVREGAVGEAVRSAARAGDWDLLRELLRQESVELATSLCELPDLPPAVRDRDPWVLRAAAVRLLGEGDVAGAGVALRSAVAHFSESGGHAGTEALLRATDGWLRPAPGPPHSWPAALRSALGGTVVTAWPSDQGGQLARGLGELAAGHVGEARATLAAAMDGASPLLRAMAAVGQAAAEWLAGADTTGPCDRALTLARAVEAPAVVLAAEVVASGAALVGSDPAGQDVTSAFRAFWSALAELTEAHEDVVCGPDLEAVLGGQGLTVPLAVVRAAGLVRVAGGGGQVDLQVARDPAIRSAGPLAHALAVLAVGIAQDDLPARALAVRLAAAHGFEPWLAAVEEVARRRADGQVELLPAPVGTAAAPTPRGVAAPVAATVALDVLGGFTVSRDGEEVDVGALRPRHLELLQVLAVHANAWIHRETLWELLWAGRPSGAASHNLHVAVSAVRRLLEPHASRGRSSVLTRSGDRYRLEVPPGDCDVCRFEQRLQVAAEAHRAGDRDGALAALGGAVREWRGEPVPGAGPVDWAVARRDELRRRCTQVAVDVLAPVPGQGVAPSLDASALAADVLRIDPFDERLWQHALGLARGAGAGARVRALEASYAARFPDRDEGAGAARPRPGLAAVVR